LQPGEPQPPEASISFEEEEEELVLTPAIQMLLEKGRDIAEEIIRRLMEFREERSSSGARLWEVVESKIVRRRLGMEDPPPGVAIDSTFPIDGGMELVGGRLVAIVAGYVGFNGFQSSEGPRGSYAVPKLVDSEEALKVIPYYAKLYEKALARRLLAMISSGRANAKIILFDGELVPYPLLFKHPKSIAKSRILSKLAEVMPKLLREAEENSITLVGVVKRSYSKLLAVLAGRKLPLNDKAVMSILLRHGEYAYIGKFGELLPRYASIIASERGGDAAKYREAVEAALSSCSYYKDIAVVFYKPHGTSPSHQAVRVEILDFGGYGLDRILSMLNKLTNPATGLPYPIDLVDEYIRLEARVLELLRRRVVGYLAQALDYLGPAAVMLLGHTNPEKRYLYEPRRLSRSYY
jgi:hypothetical protein